MFSPKSATSCVALQNSKVYPTHRADQSCWTAAAKGIY